MAMALELTRFGSLISGSDPKLAATLQDPCKTVPIDADGYRHGFGNWNKSRGSPSVAGRTCPRHFE